MRKVTKTKGALPSTEAVRKLLYLATGCRPVGKAVYTLLTHYLTFSAPNVSADLLTH